MTVQNCRSICVVFQHTVRKKYSRRQTASWTWKGISAYACTSLFEPA